jgi:hypothetical protein
VSGPNASGRAPKTPVHGAPVSTPTSPLALADDPSLDLPFSAAGPRAVNPSIVNLASVAAAQVDVEDLIGTELVADIDHLSRFGDAVRERFTVQPADKDLWRRCAERDWQLACPTMVQSRVSVETIPSFASSCASSVARATKQECLERPRLRSSSRATKHELTCRCRWQRRRSAGFRPSEIPQRSR